MNVYQGSPIVYSCVTEFLDQAQTSFIASNYLVASDEERTVLFGDYTPSFPLSNAGWNKGLELARYYGTYADNKYSLVEEQQWSYSVEAAATQIFDNYVIHKKYHPLFTAGPSAMAANFTPYTIIHYPFYSRWYKLDSILEKTYASDKKDNNTITTNVSYRYNNFDKLLFEEEFYNSKGEKIIKRVNRPKQMLDSGRDPDGIYAGMVSGHLLDPVVEEIQLNNGNPISLIKTSYFTPFAGLYVPQNVDRQIGGNPMERLVNYHAYDNKGNLLSASYEKGPKSCYVWGYGGQYLIAKIENCEYSSLSDVLDGTSTVESFRNNLIPTDAAVNAFLSTLRNHLTLKQAQVTTYTYRPLVGMTSATDAAGVTTYYEYDDFQCLKRVKDQEGNIVKQNIYHYKGQ